MKSLQLIKTTMAKPAITAISIYYIILIVFLILLTPSNSSGPFIISGTTPVFLFIFALIQVVYMFKFSQNVCVSRKTCFVAAVYTILGIAIITTILDMLFVLLENLTSTRPNGYAEYITLAETFVTVSKYIAIVAWGMLIGITWYRLTKFVRICVGITGGILLVMRIPMTYLFLGYISKYLENIPLWLVEIVATISASVSARGIWTILVNIGIAAAVTGIFYLVIRKAQITELK